MERDGSVGGFKALGEGGWNGMYMWVDLWVVLKACLGAGWLGWVGMVWDGVFLLASGGGSYVFDL